jgi:hypothetical protein
VVSVLVLRSALIDIALLLLRQLVKLAIARFLDPSSLSLWRGVIFRSFWFVILAIAVTDRTVVSLNAVKTIILMRCEIGLYIKVRVAELCVGTLTLFNNGTNSSTAVFSSGLVALCRVTRFGVGRVRICKKRLVETLGEDRSNFAWSLGVILSPELGYESLRAELLVLGLGGSVWGRRARGRLRRFHT